MFIIIVVVFAGFVTVKEYSMKKKKRICQEKYNKALEFVMEDKIDEATKEVSTLKKSDENEDLLNYIDYIQRYKKLDKTKQSYMLDMNSLYMSMKNYKCSETKLKDKFSKLFINVNRLNYEYVERVKAEDKKNREEYNNKTIKGFADLINQQKYDEAHTFVAQAYSDTHDWDWIVLGMFSSYMKTKGNDELKELDPNYKGKYSGEIKKYILKKVSLDTWKNLYANRYSSEPVTSGINYDAIYNPDIGMTKEQVEKSTWGRPTEINKTTTAYGVSEQWVYDCGDFEFKFIYFDNGIVTAIQE